VHPFTHRRAESAAALGETGLIAAIRRWLGTASPRTPYGIGDDCAVLPASHGAQLLTVDSVIFGVHFDEAVTPRAAGAKLFKRNLSDIAAMGGAPRAAVVALALDPRVKLRWLEEFYRGLAAMSRRHRTPVVGGDVARLDGGIVAALTLVGEAGARRVVTRVGARAGDWIFVTGRLGGSRASGHHWKFTPRLAEGAWLAHRPEVRAMMDVSDGLAKDLPALTPPGAEAALDAAALPGRRGCDLNAILGDGEDYELLFAVAGRAEPEEFMRAWRRAFPRTRLSRIGRFVKLGRRPEGTLGLTGHRGYEHLRGGNGRKEAQKAQKRGSRGRS
jgi:thiamine-monophosphate kinase